MAKFKIQYYINQPIKYTCIQNRVYKIFSLIAKIYMIISIYMAPSPYIQLR